MESSFSTPDSDGNADWTQAQTQANDTQRRTRRMRTAGTFGLSLRVASMGVLLLTTPILVRALGDDVFGIFVTITALTAYLAMSDLGIGAGLLTVLGAAAGKGDRREMSSLVTSAGWILLASAALIAVLGLAISVAIDVPRLLGAPTGQSAEALAAFRIFVLGFAVGVPLSLGARVQSSLQQGAEAVTWLSLSSSLSAAAAAGVAWTTGELVPTMLASVGVLCLVGLVQSARVLRQHPWILAYGIRFRLGNAHGLLASSGWLFALQLAAVVAFQTDLLIVAAVLGSDQAAVFNGTLRAFGVVSLITTALASQFWPATAEAMAVDDHQWVRSTHHRLAWQLPALAAAAALFLVVFGRQLIGLWLGESLVPPLSLLLVFALWATYSSFVLPYSQVLNGAGVLRPLAILSILMAIANVLMSLALTNAIGISGPPLGSILAHGAFLLGPMLFFVRRAWANPQSHDANEAR